MLKVGLAVSAVLALCLQDVDNPEYKNWSSCKAGSWVTFKLESEAAGNKTEMEQTHKLVEINADKAVLETSGKMVVAGNTMDLPASKRDIAAKMKKVEGKEGEKPKEGDEEIEVGGKKVKCHWVESNTEASGTKTWAKSWMCDDIPGRIAKVESKSEGSMASSMKMWASGWEKK